MHNRIAFFGMCPEWLLVPALKAAGVKLLMEADARVVTQLWSCTALCVAAAS